MRRKRRIRYGRSWSPLPVGKRVRFRGATIVRTHTGFVVYDRLGRYKGVAGSWLGATELT